MEEEKLVKAAAIPIPSEDQFGQESSIVGELSDEEKMALAKHRQQLQQHTMTLGQFEVQKARVFTVIAQLENQMETILKQAGTRLGLTGEHQWSVSQDGKVRIVIPEGDLGPPKEA